jgi:hypothetical protein
MNASSGSGLWPTRINCFVYVAVFGRHVRKAAERGPGKGAPHTSRIAEKGRVEYDPASLDED